MRIPVLALVLTIVAFALPPWAARSARAQLPKSPYEVSVFATPPKDIAAAGPITVAGDTIFVTFNGNHIPGSVQETSRIVAFDRDGKAGRIYSNVPGHNTGLGVDPATGNLWALQTRKDTPILAVINPKTGAMQTHILTKNLHGGTFDTVLFLHGKAYFTAAHPAKNPNTGPAIVSVTLSESGVTVEPVLMGNAEAFDVTTGETVQLNLRDPHAITVDGLGNVLLTSPPNKELIFVNAIGTADQRAIRLLSDSYFSHPPERQPINVTAVATTTRGYLLVTDWVLNKIMKISCDAFLPGTVFTITRYSALSSSGAGYVGALNLPAGNIREIDHFPHPIGLVFVSTGP
jgi:hypothetical protein